MMHTVPVQHSRTLSQAANRFLDDLRAWALQCIEEHQVGNGHDQATFTTAWTPCIRNGQGDDLLAYMLRYRDEIRERFERPHLWKHGYWTFGESHHGTEHFELFLGTLLQLAPDDAETHRQLIDAAEHFGNWVSDIPEWFDWNTGLFRSMYFGTHRVRLLPGSQLNVADHLRCLNVCLLAHQAGGGERFLHLARANGGLWADAVCNRPDALPAGLLPDGAVYSIARNSDSVYHGFVGMAGDLADPIDVAENLLASGGVNLMLYLWRLTTEDRFRNAAERIVDVLATQLDDPDAGAAADAIRTYRRATTSQRFDECVLAATDRLPATQVAEMGVETHKREGLRLGGVGKRNDKPNWFEDGQPARRNPILLALAAEIRMDEALAVTAMDLAHTRFLAARRALAGNLHHGCAANTVSAIARGHGRENNAGMATAVLAPLLDVFTD
ncbi:MAG: hypothetical protein KAI66_03485 [Lentisphaeria bacterium]|nr:hypothetical protein [Lentisphaeria bacterium]